MREIQVAGGQIEMHVRPDLRRHGGQPRSTQLGNVELVAAELEVITQLTPPR